jgi:hypothetical protein
LLRELQTLPDADAARLAHCRLALGEVLALLGDAASRMVLFDAVRHFEAVDDLEALAKCAALLLRDDDSSVMGDHAAVVDFVERILPRLDELPAALVARVCARYAAMIDFSGQLERQRALSYRAFMAAKEAGDEEALALALYYLRPGIYPDRDVYREHDYELVELGRRTHNVEYQFEGLIQAYWREVDLGDIEAADRVLAEAEELAERIPRGAVSSVAGDLKLYAEASLAVRRSIQATLAGHLDDADRHLADLSAFAAMPGRDQGRLIGILAGQLGQLADDRGRLGELADGVEALVADQPDMVAWQIYHSFVFSESGQQDKAARFYLPLIAGNLEALESDHLMTTMLVLLARIAYRRCDEQGAQVIEARLLPYRGRNSCNAVNSCGPIDWALGMCTATQRRWNDATAHLGGALDLCRRMGSPTYEARTELTWAETLARAGCDPEGVRAHAERARALAGALGMARVEQEAQDVLTTMRSQGPV